MSQRVLLVLAVAGALGVASPAVAQEAKLVAELRTPLCAAIARWRPKVAGQPMVQVTGTGNALEVDLIGLSGHSSIFSVETVCPQCADRMETYYDATGVRFCDSGGLAGRTCEEAKPFPRTGTVHRKGSADALWIDFGCR